MNGSIVNSAVTVNSGATLSGTGTVGGITIASGGTFAPGNSPGTMTVQGNLAFQSGALYLVQLNSTTASSTNVSGSAALLRRIANDYDRLAKLAEEQLAYQERGDKT